MENTVTRIPLIGDKAPAFKALTSNGVVNFPEDYAGKWVVLFSHPADFTPVCSTEFMTFAKREKEFNQINAHLLGLSIDSVTSHIAWLDSLEALEWKDIKNPKIDFPVIADLSMDVATKYGMIHQPGSTHAVRAVFIIDPEGTVRLIMYYPASTGRNFNEIYRAVLALQKSDRDGVATPADWHPGDDVIDPIPEGKQAALERCANPGEDRYCLDWYLCFKRDK